MQKKEKEKSKVYTFSMTESDRKKIQKQANKFTDGVVSKLIVKACLKYKGEE